MKKWVKPIIVFLLISGVIGGLTMVSGIVPIGASGGHWPITEWILSFSMERSIKTRSIMLESPDLNDPAMIQRGAGHYEIGCRHCHGTIDKTNFLGTKSTPEAPLLSEEIPHWKARELFKIVKHGVKFTGMPAWPSLEREDEIWDVVAFLLHFKKINDDDYHDIIGTKDIIDPFIKKCSICHGSDGNGRLDGAFPKLSGQNEVYLESSLHSYKKGERNSGTMELVAHSLEKESIRELARYFSKQPRTHTKSNAPLESIERGRKIAEEGIKPQHVAACISCHGSTNPHFPDLRGQPAGYLRTQLKLFMEEKRGGSAYKILMEKAVMKLSPSQIEDVSNYYESLVFKKKN